MKVAIITNTSGGLFLFRRDLLKRILKNNTIDILSSDTGKIEGIRQLGCNMELLKMDRRGKNPAKEIALFYRYFKFLLSKRPDVTITYTIKPNIYGGLICSILHLTYSSNITGLGTAFEKNGFLRNAVVFLYKLALHNAKTVFFENLDNMNMFLKEHIISRSQACLLNGAGVNLDFFYLQPYPADGTFRFLFMGRSLKIIRSD